MTEAAPAPSAPLVLVRNLSGRMLTLTLTGKHLASAPPGTPHRYKAVKLVTVHHAKTGELVPHVRKALMADSIRIPAGEDARVAKSATYCPDFRKAVAAKWLRVVADPAPPAPPEVPRVPTRAEERAKEQEAVAAKVAPPAKAAPTSPSPSTTTTPKSENIPTTRVDPAVVQAKVAEMKK